MNQIIQYKLLKPHDTKIWSIACTLAMIIFTFKWFYSENITIGDKRHLIEWRHETKINLCNILHIYKIILALSVFFLNLIIKVENAKNFFTH